MASKSVEGEDELIISCCLELALEGERLCKTGDFRSGVAFFEAAIQAGTDDLKTLSAIYSQLGNAYFFIGDYNKAVNYHKHDLTLARTLSDGLGEAKASGNLGNTLKVMGKYDEAIMCCKRHLDITTQLDDKIGKARALYNLANAYHAKGKHVGRLGQQDPGEFPDEVKNCLAKALHYYQENLALTRELCDRSGEGRASGNLGNVHYLMGNFEEAILFHEKRLEIAKEFGDKNAQRRAYTNLGNALVFSGNFELAANHYKKSLLLSQELSDRAVEAQACYSLGNTYTLLRDYINAIEYHLRHLQIAQQLNDKVGEGRAYWSLGNAHSAMGEHRQALHFAKLHLVVSKELGDQMGQATASMNVNDLKKVIDTDTDEGELVVTASSSNYSRRKSMSEMKLILTPDSKSVTQGKLQEEDSSSCEGRQKLRSYSVGTVLFNKNSDREIKVERRSEVSEDDEGEEFFDMLTRVQADRLNDQRCVMPKNNTTNGKKLPNRANSLPGHSKTNNKKLQLQHQLHQSEQQDSIGGAVGGANCGDDLMDMIWGMQSKRMDEQRASLPDLPEQPTTATGFDKPISSDIDEEDDFFDMLMRCQSSRLEDQRSELPLEQQQQDELINLPVRGLTVPDEDFFSLIARLQDKRMNDQRADIKDLYK